MARTWIEAHRRHGSDSRYICFIYGQVRDVHCWELIAAIEHITAREVAHLEVTHVDRTVEGILWSKYVRVTWKGEQEDDENQNAW